MRVDELPPPGESRVSVRESARLLGVHIGAIYRWIRRGKLGAWLLGGRYVLSRVEVLAFPTRTGTLAVDPKTKEVRMPSHAEAVAMLRREGYTI